MNDTNSGEKTAMQRFDKGIEYFSEVFFFYGILFAVAAGEMIKANKSSAAAKKRVDDLEDECEVLLAKTSALCLKNHENKLALRQLELKIKDSSELTL